jgi:hypothetical protein
LGLNTDEVPGLDLDQVQTSSSRHGRSGVDGGREPLGLPGPGQETLEHVAGLTHEGLQSYAQASAEEANTCKTRFFRPMPERAEPTSARD